MISQHKCSCFLFVGGGKTFQVVKILPKIGVFMLLV